MLIGVAYTPILIGLVEKEIKNNGLTIAQAVDRVYEDEHILKRYKELREGNVRRKVKSLIRDKLYKKYNPGKDETAKKEIKDETEDFERWV